MVGGTTTEARGSVQPGLDESPDGSRAPRVIVSPPDPYLAFLIRAELPEADVVEAEPAAMRTALSGADLLLLDIGKGDGAVPPAVEGLRVIGVVDRATASDAAPPAGLDGLLVRPFLPAEMTRMVRRSLALPVVRQGTRPNVQGRLRDWLAPARVAAVALGAIFELASPDVSPLRAVILATAFVYVALRFRWGSRGARGVWADVLAGALLVASTGGLASSYVYFGALAVAQVGLLVGGGPGLSAAVLVAAGTAPSTVGALAEGGQVGRLALWLEIFAAAALAGALARRIWGAARDRGSAALAQANEVLSTLYRIARTAPGSLDLGSVAAATMEEVRETLRAPSGALLVGDAGIFVVAGSFGMSYEGAVALPAETPGLAELLGGDVRVVDGGDLPGALGVEGGCWLSAPLRHEGRTTGLLLAACSDHGRHDANRLFCDQLSREAAVAVENVRLFARVGALSADEERRRLARELHDGVAQSLAHVRFELELLARKDDSAEGEVQDEAARLSRVVGRALQEVRTTISGLRAGVAEGSMAEALGAYLRDLEGLGGARITYRTRGEVDPPAGMAHEIFRMAQEAVGNALRHARASEIRVTLDGRRSLLCLRVEDDGVGIGPEARGAGGLGLHAMAQRARALGGRLEVEPGAVAGTRVELLVETGRGRDEAVREEPTT